MITSLAPMRRGKFLRTIPSPGAVCPAMVPCFAKYGQPRLQFDHPARPEKDDARARRIQRLAQRAGTAVRKRRDEQHLRLLILSAASGVPSPALCSRKGQRRAHGRRCGGSGRKRKVCGRFPLRREDGGEIWRNSNRIPEGCNFGPSGGLLKRK